MPFRQPAVAQASTSALTSLRPLPRCVQTARIPMFLGSTMKTLMYAARCCVDYLLGTDLPFAPRQGASEAFTWRASLGFNGFTLNTSNRSRQHSLKKSQESFTLVKGSALLSMNSF